MPAEERGSIFTHVADPPPAKPEFTRPAEGFPDEEAAIHM
jgi:hypothetical protein